VSVAEPPAAPAMVAEIVAVPALTAVAIPVELTVATAGLLDDQVTWSVTFEEEEGWLPCSITPVAVYCAVCPTTRLCVAGVTSTLDICVLEQPVNGRTKQISPSTFKQLRADILILLTSLGTAPKLFAAKSHIHFRLRILVQSSSNQSPGESVFLLTGFLRNQVG
jgi:hypothetical protein